MKTAKSSEKRWGQDLSVADRLVKLSKLRNILLLSAAVLLVASVAFVVSGVSALQIIATVLVGISIYVAYLVYLTGQEIAQGKALASKRTAK